MKLFVFQHCPYCIKAMMVAAYKKIDVEWVYLQNHDVDARIAKVGANMVPILQKSDGSYMAESLDIAAYFDALDGQPSLTVAEFGDEISDWQRQIASFNGPLVHPRWMMIDLPEFQLPEAKAWYTRNKSAMIGMSFEQAYANTADFLEPMNALLSKLNWLRLPSERNNQLSYDDVNLYPTLRNLTVVKGIQFPERVRQYLDEITALTTIPLYDEVAV
ncbi:glutaredoxin 2 [Vibrio fluvialis]|uniref:glutaredoxin 2 n=1 Tax=Vibrio fluvialis TaxID=676 RepID=UPI001559C5D5|nr:glutaredoxin 2 [Vibrio fluvialis]EKO3932829.1 glutaredoxin 2 [Vibrio fluvialis]ELV8682646.1 glutaredoxin 2 [Vibrio fluvialis]EMC0407279.1 glutaredoxin 2 [Vibrio fluvialis]MBY8037994.1 glutaredoxin 2 [Vibrio fluvialis]MCE7614140.1 glutaredoxin 2 [Vibrio fluvialis]